MGETLVRPRAAEQKTFAASGIGPDEQPRRNLRRILILGDAVSLVVAAVVAMLTTGIGNGARFDGIPVALVPVLAGLVALHAQHLYRARVAAVRSVEIAGLMRTALVVGIAGFLAARTHGNRESIVFALVVGATAFAGLFVFRSQFQSWLTRARRRGRYLRRVVLVGDNAEARELAILMDDHPELGLQLAGVVATSDLNVYQRIDLPRTDQLDDILEFVRATDANGVVIAATAVGSAECNRLVRDLLDADVHVHYSLGLRGISIDRVRPLPFAHEPLFYVEQLTLSPFQTALKRAIDVIAACGLLVVFSPVLLAAAIAIKFDDRGPVFFRQKRVGRHGAIFEIIKLRSMSASASVHHPSSGLENERTDGPLFKLAADPRRTRVGRILERASIDEIPQLVNVLKGDMSLVGPRPALPEEVELFDSELRARHNVRPGITGLWQVEARDNPSFRAYRRLDLFYIENYSPGLDFAILLGTAEAVLGRVLSRGPRSSEPVAAPLLTAVAATNAD